MTTTTTTPRADWPYGTVPGASWLGARVRVGGGGQFDGQAGTVIKVNRRTIRVQLDEGGAPDAPVTMIGHPQFFTPISPTH